jgi:hypothetical protein
MSFRGRQERVAGAAQVTTLAGRRPRRKLKATGTRIDRKTSI